MDSTTETYPPLPTHQPPRRSVKGQLLAAALAFLLGAVLVGWLAWRGYLGPILPSQGEQAATDEQATEPADPATLSQRLEEAEPGDELEAVGTVEGRLAMLEDRLSRLNLQANAASGNAARAESLLIAFAARRMLDRGEPLRYLADQLRLRFADAQPRAVQTIIDFGQEPVTLDELSARLEALGPQLVGGSPEETFWDRARRELSGIFTLRREPSAVMSAEARLGRAGVMLTAGRIGDAITQVERMPGSDAATRWIADARRYDAAQAALDLIETTAMLEPSRLNDSAGRQVDQPSPLATPAAAPSASGASTSTGIPPRRPAPVSQP